MTGANHHRPTEARIDLQALRHNLAYARSLSPDKLIAVIKANGYGHGLKEVGAALKEADALAVATLEEAMELRSALPTQDIIILQGFYHPSELTYIAEHSLIIVVHSPEQVEILNANDLPLKIVLEYNSGMNRLGLTKRQFHQAINAIQAHPHQQLVFIMSHFHSANQVDRQSSLTQLEDFHHASQGLSLPRSLCNSAALINLPEARGDYDRPGLMLYGASPVDDKSATAIGLKPVMTLRSQLIATHQLKPGDRVGYEGIWQASRETRIGTVPIGYGDGYPRISHQAEVPVLVNGQRCSLSGRVSMDMLSIDLTHCPDAQVGDEVILWGHKDLPIEDVATAVDHITYDLLAGLTSRVRRVYKVL